MNKKFNNNGKNRFNKSKNSSSRRGGKSKSNAKSKAFDKDERVNDMPGYNDPSWYSKYPNLLVAAGSFPYPYRPGMKLNFGDAPINGLASGETGARKYTIPGVMMMDWIPSIGKSTRSTDPASLVGKEIYARVRKAYSGSLAADAPDYVIYLMCLDSVFSYISALKRIYRLLTAWSPNNESMPDVILRGMGFTSSSIANMRINRTQLWQNINELVLQSRKFTCPASMDIMNRHYWMSDNVYADAPSVNAQFYCFNLAGVFKYATAGTPEGEQAPAAAITRTPWVANPSGYVTVTDLYTFGRSMIEALVAWDDSYTISGYLARAFEGEPQFIVDEIPQDALFVPEYSEEVLMQIENSRTVPLGEKIVMNTVGFEGLVMSQDVVNNAVIWNPYYEVLATDPDYDNAFSAYAATVNPGVNIHKDSVSVVDTVEATRLAATWSTESVESGNADYVKVIIDSATEIPLCWRAVGLQTLVGDAPSITPGVSFKQYWTLNMESGVTAANMTKDLNDLLACITVEAYDWHPFSYITILGGAANNLAVGFNICGDIHNYTIMRNEDFENLHKICVYSELNAFGF